MVILLASSHLWQYHNKAYLIENLKAYPLTDSGTLENAWPPANWRGITAGRTMKASDSRLMEREENLYLAAKTRSLRSSA